MIKSYESQIRSGNALSFIESINYINFTKYFGKSERFKYTKYIRKKGEQNQKDLTIYSFPFIEELKNLSIENI